MFDAMFELIGANGISVDGDYRMSRSPGTPTYVCADGRRILFNSTSMPRFRRWFAEAAGHGHALGGAVFDALRAGVGDRHQRRGRTDGDDTYAVGVAR